MSFKEVSEHHISSDVIPCRMLPYWPVCITWWRAENGTAIFRLSVSSAELCLGDYIVQRRHVRYIIVARGNWVLSLPASRVIFAVARRWVEGKVQCGCCKHRDAAARRPAALSPESSGTWKSHSCPRSGSLRTADHAISAIPLDGGGKRVGLNKVSQFVTSGNQDTWPSL